MKLLWCDTEMRKVVDGKEVVTRCKVMRPMTLLSTTVKSIPHIDAYCCDVCGTPSWLPGSSIRKFLEGINAR